jgi:hypothetical protein
MTDLRPEDERLASRLDQALPPGVSRAPRQTSDPLVNTALLLARLQVPPLSAEADARIQQRVLAAMRGQKVRSSWRVTPYVRWLAAACLVVVLFTAGIFPIAAASLPGDILYPVKLGLERVELLLATNAEQQARVNLTQAERRLDEQLKLVERGQFEPSLVSSALASMRGSSDAALVSGNADLMADLEARSTILTLRFAGLAETATENRLPSPHDQGAASPVVGGEATDVVPSATPQPTNTLQPSLTPAGTATPFAPARPVMLPMPPGLATRLAPAAGIISTQVAEATATCEHGRSCLSSSLSNGNGSSNSNAGGNNSSSNSNAGGNNGRSNSNAGGNSGSSNGNAGGNSGSDGSSNGNAGGNSGQTGGNAGNGNAGGASNGGGNGNGSNQGNSGGSGPPADPGGGSQGNGNANGSSNGNSGGNSNGSSNGNGNNGNANGNSGSNGGGSGSSGNGSSSGNSGNGNNGNGNGSGNGNGNGNS